MEESEKLIGMEGLTPPTKPDLQGKYEQASRFELRIIYLFTQVDQNLYSFICGIVTGIPISVLFDLLNMNVREMPYRWGYFALYLMLLLDTAVMTVAAIKFTMLHISICEKASDESVKEASRNSLYQQIFDAMPVLKKVYHRFVTSFVLFVFLVIVLFAVNNIDFAWLSEIIKKMAEPLVTN